MDRRSVRLPNHAGNFQEGYHELGIEYSLHSHCGRHNGFQRVETNLLTCVEGVCYPKPVNYFSQHETATDSLSINSSAPNGISQDLVDSLQSSNEVHLIRIDNY